MDSTSLLARSKVANEYNEAHLISKIEDRLRKSERLTPSDWNYYSAVMNGSNSANQGTIENHPYKFKQDITAYAESLSDVDELLAIQAELKEYALPDLSSHNSRLAYWSNVDKYVNSDVRPAETKPYSEHISEIRSGDSEHLGSVSSTPRRSKFGSVLRTLGKVAAGIMVPLATVYGAVALSHAHANDPTKKFGKDSLEKIIKYQAQDNNSTSSPDSNYSIIKLAENVTANGVDISERGIVWGENNSKIILYTDNASEPAQIGSGIKPTAGDKYVAWANGAYNFFVLEEGGNVQKHQTITPVVPGEIASQGDSIILIGTNSNPSEPRSIITYNSSLGVDYLTEMCDIVYAPIDHCRVSPVAYKDQAYWTTSYNSPHAQFMIKNLTTGAEQKLGLTPQDHDVDGNLLVDLGSHIYYNNPDFQTNISNYSKMISVLNLDNLNIQNITLNETVKKVAISGKNLVYVTDNGSVEKMGYYNLSNNNDQTLLDGQKNPEHILNITDLAIQNKSIIWSNKNPSGLEDIFVLDIGEKVYSQPNYNHSAPGNGSENTTLIQPTDIVITEKVLGYDPNAPAKSILNQIVGNNGKSRAKRNNTYINSLVDVLVSFGDNVTSAELEIIQQNLTGNETQALNSEGKIDNATTKFNTTIIKPPSSGEKNFRDDLEKILLKKKDKHENKSIMKLLRKYLKDQPDYYISAVTIDNQYVDIEDFKLTKLSDLIDWNKTTESFMVASPVDFEVFDANESIQGENNVFYSGPNFHPEFLTIFDGVEKEYEARLTGTGNGTYTFIHERTDDHLNIILDERVEDVPITDGEVHIYHTSIANNTPIVDNNLSNPISNSTTPLGEPLINQFTEELILGAVGLTFIGAGAGWVVSRKKKEEPEVDSSAGQFVIDVEDDVVRELGPKGSTPNTQLPDNPTSPEINLSENPTSPGTVLELFDGFESKIDDLPEMDGDPDDN